MIDLRYKTKTVEKQCTNLKKAQRAFGQKTAVALFGLINLLESSPSLQDVNALMIYNLHKLSGNLKGLCALDIAGRSNSYRLIIQPLNDAGDPVIDRGSDLIAYYSNVNIIRIEEVSNHYE